MGYPDTSRWDSAATNSAWYARRVGSAAPTSVCQTDGARFVATLEGELYEILRDLGAAVSFDGAAVGPEAVEVATPDIAGQPGAVPARWTVGLLRALYAVGLRYGAPPDALAATAADARGGGVVSRRTLQFAIWVASYWKGTVAATGAFTYGQGSPDEVVLPEGSLLAPPRLGVEIAIPRGYVAGYGLSCARLPDGAALPVPGLTILGVNPWVALGVLTVAVVGVSYVTRSVPTGATVRAQQQQQRARRTRTRARAR